MRVRILGVVAAGVAVGIIAGIVLYEVLIRRH
jgi:hypothetical protein